jgi:hypothetical protein
VSGVEGPLPRLFNLTSNVVGVYAVVPQIVFKCITIKSGLFNLIFKRAVYIALKRYASLKKEEEEKAFI